MLNNKCLSLIASSVDFFLRLQSLLIHDNNLKLNEVDELILKEVFQSFETKWKNTKIRQKCFEVLFRKYFADLQSLERYEHLLFIFKFNYEKFLVEKFHLYKTNIDNLKSAKLFYSLFYSFPFSVEVIDLHFEIK